jgi:hypothetical protein
VYDECWILELIRVSVEERNKKMQVDEEEKEAAFE